MPKIVIKEYDYTKPGSTKYENFAVLVPGFVASGKNPDFDENGVIEFTDQAEFKKQIGCVSSGSASRKFATITKHMNADTQSVEVDVGTISQADMAKYWGNIYRAIVMSSAPADTAGKNIYKQVTTSGDDETITYYSLVKETGEVVKEPEGYSYAIVLPGNEGNDTGDSVNHYGNQMAYELLGLGYTVYYKKLDATDNFTKDDYLKGLQDKSLYDFRYIVTGYADATGIDKITALANYNNTSTSNNGRGDCVALIDIPETCYSTGPQSTVISNIKSTIKLIGNKYSAIFAPYVEYKKEYPKDTSGQSDYNSCRLPASFHYLACAKTARENNYPEYFAVSGYSRGITNDFSIASVGYKFGETAVNELQRRNIDSEDTDAVRAVNLIITEKGNHYLWGNRTANQLGSKDNKDHSDLIASDFLNIRQLCTTIKKQLYVACRRFTFDPNSDVLWSNFCSAIRPTLDKMKANEGIRDYKIEPAKTDKKAVLRAKIRIVPIEAVEDFEINMYLEDSVSGNIEFED